MKIKKIISLMLAVVLILSCGITALAQNDSSIDENYNVQPRFLYIRSFLVNIEKTGSEAEGSSTVLLGTGCTGTIVLSIQKYTSSGWVNVSSKTKSLSAGTNTIKCEKDNLENNCKYRAEAYVYIYSNNVQVESTNSISKTITT